VFSTGRGVDLMTHQALSTNNLSQEAPLRRRRTRNNRGASVQSHPTPNGRLSRGRRFAVTGVVDAREPDYDEKTADVDSWEPNDSAPGGFTEKV